MKCKNFFQVYFQSKEEALEEVRKGHFRQMLYFPSNFSKAVTILRARTLDVTDEELEMQQIGVYRDSAGVYKCVLKNSYLDLLDLLLLFGKLEVCVILNRSYVLKFISYIKLTYIHIV